MAKGADMTTYVLTYDFRMEETSEDYKPLLDEIKRLGGHRFQKAAWLLNLNNTASEAHDHFKALVDDNDHLPDRARIMSGPRGEADSTAPPRAFRV
jgi:hypothetical protein